MLSCFDAALRVKGRKIAQIARDLEMSASAIHSWFSGRKIVPDRKRGALDAAIGARVDWAAYAREVSKTAGTSAPTAPPKPAAAPQARAMAPADTWGAEPPRKPPAAPQARATAPADTWGEDAPPKPTAAPQARPTAPRRGFFGSLIRDDESEGLGA